MQTVTRDAAQWAQDGVPADRNVRISFAAALNSLLSRGVLQHTDQTTVVIARQLRGAFSELLGPSAAMH